MIQFQNMRKDWYLLPEETREHGLDFHWDNQKVWKLDIPTEEMDIKEIKWIMEINFWWKDDMGNTISPNEVLANLDMYPDHKDRILYADTSYPLDIMKNRHGRWLTLDGLHRLAKLIINNETKIIVRKISRELIPIIEK